MPPTQRMKDGEAGHEAVSSLAEPSTKEEAIEVAVEERELPICPYEFNIGWKYKDGPIVGKVDEAWFRECDMGVARVYLYAFDKSTITKDLDWALGYWLCQRDAVPSHNKAKCKVC